jgi:hypothetical protein
MKKYLIDLSSGVSNNIAPLAHDVSPTIGFAAIKLVISIPSSSFAIE